MKTKEVEKLVELLKELVCAVSDIKPEDIDRDVDALDKIEETDWKDYTDGSDRMIYWTKSPYTKLAKELCGALYCLSSDGMDTDLCKEGMKYMNQTVNNCLKDLGVDIRIEIK